MTTEQGEPQVRKSPIDFVVAASGTDIGKKREENQDSLGTVENSQFKIFAVADGMGGVKGGAIASALAVAVFKDLFQKKSDLEPEDFVDVLEIANSQIHQKGLNEPGLSGMGTTFVGLAFQGHDLIIANVGDSRAYRFRGSESRQLTEDHTLVNELVRQGAITAEQAVNHPVSHMLTRSLGPTSDITVDSWLSAEKPLVGDRYLLCSDGLYNLVSAEEMSKAFESNPLSEVPKVLIDLANERGGSDNITIIVIQILDGFSEGNDVETVKRETASNEDVTSSEDTKALVVGPSEQSSEDKNDVASSSEEPESPEVVPSISLSGLSESAHLQQQDPELEHDQEGTSGAKVQFEQDFSEAHSASDSNVEHQQPSSVWPVPQKSRSGLMLAVLTLGVVGGIVLTKVFDNGSRQDPPAPLSSPVVMPTKRQPAQSILVTPPASTPEVSATSVQISNEVAQAKATTPAIESSIEPERNSQPNTLVRQLSPGDLKTAKTRREILLASINDLDNKIASFDRPYSGNTGRILAEATQQKEKIDNELEEVRSKIEVATRRLAIWFGRRKRIQESDPINMAAEIAVSSEAVKQKKEEFERATFNYLKETEALSYKPGDEKQERVVKELLDKRKQVLTELVDAIRRAIDLAVSESDKQISELTLERDRLDGKLAKLKREVQYARILMGNDKSAKEIKRKELMQDRAAAQAEFDELNRLIPPEPEATIEEVPTP